MSIDHNLYLGPYFRCRTHQESVATTIAACSNKACKRYGEERHTSAPHCSSCGARIDSAFSAVETETVPSHWEVCEEINEVMYVAEIRIDDDNAVFHRYVPNVDRPGCDRGFFIDHNDVAELRIEDVDPEGEKAWLNEAFGDVLPSLISAYGGGNVETHWGLLKWTS